MKQTKFAIHAIAALLLGTIEESSVLDITDQFNSEGIGTVGKWN